MDPYAPLVLQILCTVCFASSCLAVGLRVWVRQFILHRFARDDWAMLLTQTAFTIWYPCQMVSIHFGAGRHMWDLSDGNATMALTLTYFNEILSFLVSVMVKVALCLFLLRMAKERIHIFILKIVMCGNMVGGAAFFFVLAFQCWPISSFWDIDPASAANCVPTNVMVGLFVGLSALNVVADWTIGILPFFMLRHLQIPAKQKRVVQGILAFAAVGSTATVIQTPYLGALWDSHSGRGGDFTHKIGPIILWTCVELSVGIVAGSLVTLRPLLRAAFDRWSSSTHSQKHGRARLLPPDGAAGLPHLLHAVPKAWNGINSLSEFDMMSLGGPAMVTTIEGAGRSTETARPPPLQVWPAAVKRQSSSSRLLKVMTRAWSQEEQVPDLRSPEKLVVEVNKEIEVLSICDAISKQFDA